MNNKPLVRIQIGALLAMLMLSLQVGASTASNDPPEPSSTTTSVATAYYDALAGEAPLSRVPMAPGIAFRSPQLEFKDRTSFHAALTGLVQQVRSLEIHSQMVDNNLVMTFYSRDLGAPTRPIPMAEQLIVKDGEITEIELIFDSARLPPRRG